MNLKRGLFALFLIFILNAGKVQGADQDVYIDASAEDGGIGSWAQPYNEFSDINWESGGENSIADWVAAGDDVHIKLKRGEIWHETLRVKASGTVGHPITIESYGTDDNPVIDANGVDSGIWLDQKSYVTINKLTLQNSDYANISLRSSDHLNIKDCKFLNAKIGVFVRGENRIDAKHIIIDNCYFTNLTNSGVSAIVGGWGNGSGDGEGTVFAFVVKNSTFEHLNSAIGISGYEAIVIGHGGLSPYEIIIENNSISNTNQAAIRTGAGLRNKGTGSFIRKNTLLNIGDPSEERINALQLNWARGLTVEDNIIDTVRTSFTDGSGIILDWGYENNNYLSDGVIVRRNVVRNCRAQGDGKGISVYKAKNSRVYNNIVINCTMGIKMAKVETTGTKCYNNTIVDCTDGAVFNRSGVGTEFYNNIIYNSIENGIRLWEAAVPDSDYNCVFNSGIFNFKHFTKGVHTIELNPLFRDATNEKFRLKYNSPCIDAGIDVGLTSDFIGQPVPYNGSPDIGVYEWRPGTTGISAPAQVQDLRTIAN